MIYKMLFLIEKYLSRRLLVKFPLVLPCLENFSALFGKLLCCIGKRDAKSFDLGT